MRRVFKTNWTDSELDKALDGFRSLTKDRMLPRGYAREASRWCGAHEHRILHVVNRRIRQGRLALVDGRIPVRRMTLAGLLGEVGTNLGELAGWGLFRKLLGYYAECVRSEAGGSFRLWSDKLGDKFAYLSRRGDWFPSWSGEIRGWYVSDASTESFEKLVEKPDGDFRLGYPVYAETVPGLDGGDPVVRITPVFCWRVTRRRLDGATLVGLDGRNSDPEVNLSWLGEALKQGGQKRAFLEECGLFEKDLDLGIEDGANGAGASDGSAGGRTLSLHGRDCRELARVVAARFRERLVEALVPEALGDAPLAVGARPGYWNRAVLFMAEPSPYTKRLLGELERISHATDAELDATALAPIFRMDCSDAEEGSEKAGGEPADLSRAIDPPGIAFTPRQRLAVATLLESPLTVIQGPPGTGKSQVVAAVTVNERLTGGTVLISAANHKAIDSVEDRIGRLGEGLLMRCNSKDPERAEYGFAKLARGLLETAPTASDDEVGPREKLLASLAALMEERAELERRGARLSAAAEELREAEAELSELEERLLPASSKRDDALDQDAVAAAAGLPDAAALEGTLSALEHLDAAGGSILRLALAHPFEARALLGWSRGTEAGGLTLSSSLDAETVRGLAKRVRGSLEIRRLAARAEALRGEIRAAGGDDASERTDRLRGLTEDIRGKAEALLSIDFDARLGGLRRRPGAISGLAAVAERLRRLESGLEEAPGISGGLAPDALAPILEVSPVWAVTSLSVGKFIPLSPGLFDLVLIDEATQSGIPQAIPLLFRAKRAAVIGDPMQLQFISNLRPDRDWLMRRRAGVDDDRWLRFGCCERSLYDFAESCGAARRLLLNVNFRSCPEIADYSSRLFYRDALLVGTDEARLAQTGRIPRGFSWEDVAGTVTAVPGGSCVCREEADRVESVVRRMLGDAGFTGTIGVVTPFARQAQLINAAVLERSGIPQERLREAKFLCATAHAFQGDERDVIVLSLCAGEGMPAGCLSFIGSDPNIFNVAVSRARAAVVVVGSRAWARGCGFDHITALARDRAAREAARTPWTPYESPYEKRLGERLIREGFEVIAQHPVPPRRLDLAILLTNGSDGADGAVRGLDIEVDGDAFHRGGDGYRKAEDVWRDAELAAKGWRTLRLWTFEIRSDMDGCVRRVREALGRLEASRTAGAGRGDRSGRSGAFKTNQIKGRKA